MIWAVQGETRRNAPGIEWTLYRARREDGGVYAGDVVCDDRCWHSTAQQALLAHDVVGEDDDVEIARIS